MRRSVPPVAVKGSAGERVATTRLMRFVDATAAPDTAYEYSIRALNGSGRSGFSAAVASAAR